MSFRYVNPGYAEILTDSSTSKTSNDPTYSKQGIAFCNSSSDKKILTLPEIPEDDIFIKFDFFCIKPSYLAKVQVGYAASSKSYNITGFSISSNYYFNIYIYIYGKQIKELSASNIVKTGINSVWLHINLKNGTILFIFNGEKIIDESFNVSIADITSDFYFFGKHTTASDNYLYFSNIIISNEYINPGEEVIILPTSSVETDMTENQDGAYVADDEGQTILQKIDAQSLIDQYGHKSKVTSIVPIAAPAFRTASGLSSLISIEKNSGHIIEHNSKAVSSSSIAGVCDCWNTDLTIGDLDAKEIGWKAAISYD